MISFGPVLGFRGATPTTWDLGVLVTDPTPTPLQYRIGAGPWNVVQPTAIGDAWLPTAWRYDLSIPLGAALQTVDYDLANSNGAGPWTFTVPAAHAAPRMAYASCNGFGDPKEQRKVTVKNERWVDLRNVHASAPYQMLVMGGDQVYADEMWFTVGLLRDWKALDWKVAKKRTFTPSMQAATRRFYVDLYADRWSQPEVAWALARIPTLMMWDDHDIFDGWGSEPDDRVSCPVYQGIFKEARDAFRVHQRMLSGADVATGASGGIAGSYGFSFGHVIGGGSQAIGILGIDMRSERTDDQVLSLPHWDAIYKWMDAQTAIKHLLVLTSIPVVYPSIKTIERIIGALPGRNEIEDDLRDQWSSRAHEDERRRLVHRLLDFAHANGTRVTVLSGDVHVAAMGVISSTRTPTPSNAAVINQLTSSAIVHPAPSGIVLFGMEHLMADTFEIDRDIIAELMKVPGTERRYLGARNWLAIEPDPPGPQAPRLWANWHVEGEEHPYTKVIHPV